MFSGVCLVKHHSFSWFLFFCSTLFIFLYVHQKIITKTVRIYKLTPHPHVEVFNTHSSPLLFQSLFFFKLIFKKLGRFIFILLLYFLVHRFPLFLHEFPCICTPLPSLFMFVLISSCFFVLYETNNNCADLFSQEYYFLIILFIFPCLYITYIVFKLDFGLFSVVISFFPISHLFSCGLFV